MRLSLQDKVALIYSSAGSQRKVAGLVGVSHQIIGRILRAGGEGGYSLKSEVFKRPELKAAVNVAFQIHSDITRERARIDKLPQVPQIPIYAARMKFDKGHNKGIPGDRIEAKHLHWISDFLKLQYVAWIQENNKYVNVSAGSIVNMADYMRLADAFFANKFRDENTRAAKEKILHDVANGLVQGRMQTKFSVMGGQLDGRDIAADIWHKLRNKHQPATGAPETAFFDRLLFQLNARDETAKQFRNSHPYRAKPGAKRRAKKRRQARKAKAKARR